MNTSDTILPTLVSYLMQLPIFLVWLVGFVLAFVYWGRYPRVSLLTLIGLTIFLIETLANTYLSLWLPIMLSQRGITTAQIGVILTGKGIVTALVDAIGWGLIVAAIFSGRRINPASKDIIA